MELYFLTKYILSNSSWFLTIILNTKTFSLSLNPNYILRIDIEYTNNLLHFLNCEIIIKFFMCLIILFVN